MEKIVYTEEEKVILKICEKAKKYSFYGLSNQEQQQIIDSLKSENNDLKLEINDLKSKYESLQKEIDKMQSNLNNKSYTQDALINDLTTRIAKLEEKLNISSNEE